MHNKGSCLMLFWIKIFPWTIKGVKVIFRAELSSTLSHLYIIHVQYSIWRYLAGVQEPPCPRLLHHALELCLVPRVAGVPDLEIIATLSRDWGHAENNINIFPVCFIKSKSDPRFRLPGLFQDARCAVPGCAFLLGGASHLWQWMFLQIFHARRLY